MSEVHDRLESWKAIAEYLDHNPATVMRWAKERGLPVYVVPGEGQRRRAVYAYKGEIDAWLKKPAPPGLRADERKNEIPREARNDNRPLGELADGGDAARQNDRHNRVQRPEEAQGEIPRSARNDNCYEWFARERSACKRFTYKRLSYKRFTLVLAGETPESVGGLCGRGPSGRYSGWGLVEVARTGAEGLGD